MSSWTHNICSVCWTMRNPDRVPVSVIDAEEEICCFCGGENTDGIYVRENPDDLPCKGAHPEM